MQTILERLRILGSELVLGTLVVILSVMAAYASYQGALADSEQNKNEIAGMKALNNANAGYLEGNQNWIQDDANYTNWYLTHNTDPEMARQYEANFSDELADAIERNGTENYPMDEEYEEAIYAIAEADWDSSDVYFSTASQWDDRGDQLQLVVLIMALGLAFAAWASIIAEISKLRIVFSILAIIMFIYGLTTYLSLPAITS